MSLLTCPNCRSEMSEVKEPDITIDRCEKCGGIFLDKKELNALATGMAGDIEFCSIDDEPHKDRFPIRNCPKCPNQEMRKINLLAYSDTIFDFCPHCQGFYLDKGELRAMNIELASLTRDERAQEYRGHLQNHLVRLDKITDVMMVGRGPVNIPQNVFFLRLFVYFEKPLDIGLRICSEKWTDKISKLIGLFRKQDIRLGDQDFDRVFIIQGIDERKVKALLSSQELKRDLLEFTSDKPKMQTTQGKLEIIDEGIVLTEGPYTGSGSYDVEKDASSVVTKVIKLASLFENA